MVVGHEKGEDQRGGSHNEDEGHLRGRETGPGGIQNQVHPSPPFWRQMVGVPTRHVALRSYFQSHSRISKYRRYKPANHTVIQRKFMNLASLTQYDRRRCARTQFMSNISGYSAGLFLEGGESLQKSVAYPHHKSFLHLFYKMLNYCFVGCKGTLSPL